MYKYYLSLGSNMGDREQNIRSALHLLEQRAGKVTRCSSFFYSEPWGFQSENAFCNLCCCVESELEPLTFLLCSEEVEQTLGRSCKSVNGIYHDRTIDIDIIRAFDFEDKEIIHKDERLTIPHPLYQQRDFVTVPLREILPQNT